MRLLVIHVFCSLDVFLFDNRKMEEIMRLFLKLTILFAVWSTPCSLSACVLTDTSSACREITIEEKIYVNVDQVSLTEDGIMVLLDTGELMETSSLGYDTQGLYVKFSRYECPRHVMWCNMCRGCEPTNLCAYRCKCRRY